jgi:hypothetical protein
MLDVSPLIWFLKYYQAHSFTYALFINNPESIIILPKNRATG